MDQRPARPRPDARAPRGTRGARGANRTAARPHLEPHLQAEAQAAPHREAHASPQPQAVRQSERQAATQPQTAPRSKAQAAAQLQTILQPEGQAQPQLQITAPQKTHAAPQPQGQAAPQPAPNPDAKQRATRIGIRLSRANLLEEIASAQPGIFLVDWAGIRRAPQDWSDWAELWTTADMRLNRLMFDACRIARDRGFRLCVTGPVRRSDAPLFRSVAALFEDWPSTDAEAAPLARPQVSLLQTPSAMGRL